MLRKLATTVSLVLLAGAPAFAGGIESGVRNEWGTNHSATKTITEKAGLFQENFSFDKNAAYNIQASEDSHKQYLQVDADNFSASASAEQLNVNGSYSQDQLDASLSASGYLIGGVAVVPPFVAVAGVGGAVDAELSVDQSSLDVAGSYSAASADVAVDGQLTVSEGTVNTTMTMQGTEEIALKQSSTFAGLQSTLETSESTSNSRYHEATATGRSLF